MRARRILKITIVVCAVFFVIGYSAFQARKIVQGPRITIEAPTDGQTVATPVVRLTGSAKNVAFLYLNNKKIFTNDHGNFNEIVLVAPGVNVLELRADDKFGHEITRRITVFRKI